MKLPCWPRKKPCNETSKPWKRARVAGENGSRKRPSRTPSPKTEFLHESESPTERVIKTMPGSPRAEDKATFSVVLIGAKGSGRLSLVGRTRAASRSCDRRRR